MMNSRRADAVPTPTAPYGPADDPRPGARSVVRSLWAAGLLLFLIVVNLLAGYDLFARATAYRMLEVASWEAVPGQVVAAPESLRKDVFAQPWARDPAPSRRLCGALRWVAARNAGTSRCSRIAEEFREVLGALGAESRKISLFRNLFDPYDTHVAVEARMDGKWVVFDPTFGVSFTSRAGAPLSAFDVKRVLFREGPEGLRVQPVDPEWDPTRLKGFYMHPFQFYNNVFVQIRRDAPFWTAVPPLRYWAGPALCFQACERESTAHLTVANCLYFIVVVLLPLAELGIAAGLIRRGVRALRERRMLRA